MSGEATTVSAINIRVWYVEGGVHPTRPPVLLTLGKFSTDPSQALGDDTKVTAPDPNNYGEDIQVGVVEGSVERAAFGIGVRNQFIKSILMGWKNKRCRVDFYALMGRCGNPQDFTNGGEKAVFFRDGKPTNHSYENFGAWGKDENNPSNEMVDFTSETYWELLNEGMEQIGSAATTRTIQSIDVYTGDACENCPDPCDRILAAMAGTSATPGTKPSLLYSADGGENFTQQDITTLFSNENVTDGEIIGGDLVYVSYEGNVLVYTDIGLLYENRNLWQRVATGFVVAKGPRAISSADPRHSWIVGDGGYVYFVKNHKAGVEVQDAGVATTQHLQSVHALDSQYVLAVGNSNAVIFTTNGGISWKSATTGPAVGVNLGACWMWDATTWFVGEGSGGTGKLWLTVNSGRTWSQILLPIAPNRIDRIKFVSEAEGYIAVRSGGQSYILRTITAGNEWVTLPQGMTGVPVDNSYLSDIAVCSRTENTAFAAGQADSGAGIIVRMSNS